MQFLYDVFLDACDEGLIFSDDMLQAVPASAKLAAALAAKSANHPGHERAQRIIEQTSPSAPRF